MRLRSPTALVLLSLLLPLASLAQPTDAPVRSPPPPPMVDVPEAEEEDAPPLPERRGPIPEAPRAGASLADEPNAVVARGERPTRLARGWLIGVQTLNGLMAGLEICYIADCDEFTGAGIAGGALLGGGVSWLLTQDGISSGPAATINAGTLWGMANGLLFGIWRQDPRLVFPATVLVFTTGMTAAGIAIGTTLRPTAGQVSMANSGGLWTGVIVGLLAYGFIPNESSSRPPPVLFPIELVSINAGIAALGLLSTVHEASWGRVLLIDASGLLGTLFGFGLSYVIAQRFDRATFGLATAAGAAGGLAAGTWLTRNMDVKLPALPPVSVAPVGPQGTPGFTVGAVF
ncbi:MAG TPA: hypothetical protein VK447_17175 [Myxococcaceae bacterium]|nr:hypothetical protein [Myxococcaceae bacterium]